jgi:pyruvate/2-oxoglutarate dehydrogenase complex dihydrolipoamide acyltransferase (E2) component
LKQPQEFVMSRFVEKLFLPLVATSFIALGAPTVATAQDHVVSSKELRKDVAAQSKTRWQDEKRLERILATPEAREAMQKAGVDYKTVQKGVRTLSDAELELLAARAQKGQSDFAAGAISLREWIIILVAIIVVIIIVAAA